MFPWNEIGGGAVVGLAWIGRTLMLKRKNGHGNGNDKPGNSDVCIENSKLLAGHEVLINQLCVNQDKAEKSAETARKENREDHKEINRKLDSLIMGGK